MSSQITHYFQKLRLSPNKAKWPSLSYGKAPYKPLLLLSVLDLFDQGQIQTNLIELTTDLGELFQIYCNLILPPDQLYNIGMPFYHLRNESFWELVPIPGQEAIVDSKKELSSISQLQKAVLGARFIPEAYSLLMHSQERSELRAFLIAEYFLPKIHANLLQRSAVNQAAYQYSLDLLASAKKEKEANQRRMKEASENYNIRDQGFRRAIVLAYEHQCAFCGIRMLTPDGHTSVDAAHIIPWSKTHNDDPTNGIALCKLCHWTFDEGLMTVSKEYQIIVSAQLSAGQNIPGHMLRLKNEVIHKPQNEMLWPSREALRWHYQEVYRKY